MDHFGGIAELVQNVEQVVTLAYNETLIPADPEHPGRREVVLRHLGELVDRRPDIRACAPRAGDQWTFQGVDVAAIHPDERDVKRLRQPQDSNNGSTVLRITFAGYRVLLTGDVGGKGWQWILARGEDLQAHVLEFAHHGAWYDDTSAQPPLDEVLSKISPQIVVLSVGTRNPHGHPKPGTLKLLRTRAKLRFMCTEATERCFGALHASGQHPVPCAGTVEVHISAQGIDVTPTRAKHATVINSFDMPQCIKRSRPRWHKGRSR